MTRATRVGVALAGFLLAVLAASGAWLWWNYRPGPAGWVRVVHQVAAIALLVLAVGLLVVAIVRRAQIGGRGVVAAIGVFVTVGAAFVTGRLLPWDQLALDAVVARSDLEGAAATFDGRVRFVLLRSREVSPGTYHFWAFAHVALGVLVAATLVLVWLRTRDRSVTRRRRAPAPAAPPPE